jgi:hypothetical protein
VGCVLHDDWTGTGLLPGELRLKTTTWENPPAAALAFPDHPDSVAPVKGTPTTVLLETARGQKSVGREHRKGSCNDFGRFRINLGPVRSQKLLRNSNQ